MNLFQKKLEDIVRGARLSDIDLITYNSQVLAELKDELKSRDPEIKSGAIIKLFYFYHEGSNMEFSAFHILDCMSNSSVQVKKIGHMMASIALPASSDAMIMSTNLFKKGIKSNVVSEISIMLSCLGNITTIELGREVMDPVLNHCHNSKSVIRKKAFATLRSIYETNPNSIPQTIEKVVARLADEKEASVVSTILSIMFTALEYQPKVHPLFIKPLYALLDKKKNNWTLIKIIKLFDLLIDLEPRLKKKLYEPFLKLLSTTTAKSVEIELINVIFKHFKEFSDIYKNACHKLKSFIESTDPNLKTLGLRSLKQLLQNDKEVFEDYYEFLLDTYQKGDQFIKLTISDIFTEYLTKKNTEQAVTVMVKSLDTLSNNSSALDAADTLIQNILEICSKNYYSNVEDCEWLLMDVLLPAFSKTRKIETATKALNILTDFTLRVDEIKELAVQFGVSLLSDIRKGTLSFGGSSENSFVCNSESPEVNQLAIPSRVLETLVFIFGEYSPKIQEIKEFNSIVKGLLDVDPALLRDINAPLEICLTKMTSSLCSLILNDAVDPDTVDTEKLENFLADVFKLVKTTLSVELEKITFCKNEYMALLLEALGHTDEVLQQDKVSVTPEAVKKCKELSQIVFHPMKPIQANAQEFVVIPNEIQELEIHLTDDEKKMITAFEKEISKPIVKAVPVSVPARKTSLKGENNISDADKKASEQKAAEELVQENAENEESSERSRLNLPKTKREFRVITDEERPQELRTN